MRRPVQPTSLALALALTACDPPDDGLRKCDGDLCIEVFRGTYASEPCADIPTQSCTYVDVFFVLTDDGTSVRDLDEAEVTMRIDDHEVGVEGAASLTQENGLLVTLLLDRSYSIEEAGATEQVRDAAKGFLDALPDEAVVAVAGFASEARVPVPLGTTDAPAVDLTYFPLDAAGRSALASILDHGYAPYQAPESQAFTKLYDAVANLADLRPTEGDRAAMQAVAIVLSDGADTASSTYGSTEETIAHVTAVAPDLEIYAVGLGEAIDEPALERLSEGRAYLASDAAALSGAFAAVADDLGAIYRYRILVAEVGADARATIAVDHGGRGLRTSFDLASITDGGGGPAPGDPMVPVDPPSETCTKPCTSSEECEPGEACLDTTEGNLCMPESCGGCFELGLTCNYYADQCAFSECV